MILSDLKNKYSAYRAAEFLNVDNPIIVADIRQANIEFFDLVFSDQPIYGWLHFGANAYSRSDVSPALIDYVSARTFKCYESSISMMPTVEREYYNYGLPSSPEPFRDYLIRYLTCEEQFYSSEGVMKLRTEAPELLIEVPYALDLSGREFVYLWTTEEFETPCILLPEDGKRTLISSRFYQRIDLLPAEIRKLIQMQLKEGMKPMILFSFLKQWM